MSKKKSESPSLASTFAGLRADYNMARESRFNRKRTGLPANHGSADWHYRNESSFYQSIEKSRDMDRNDAIVGQTVDRAVSNIIQGGFSLDPQTGDPSIDADLKARFEEWANDPNECDLFGENTFHEFEQYSCRSMFVDGDCVNVITNDEKLQMHEAHTIRTSSSMPNTFCGVTKNSVGRRDKFWIWPDPSTPKKGGAEQAQPLDVRNPAGDRILFHCRRTQRMNQTRGITAFAPIFELTGMFEDIQFAKVVQQQVVSCFAIFRQRQHIADLPGSSTPGYGETTTETTSGGGTRQIDNVSPGMEIIGAPGETLEGFSPNVPNAEYFMHVKLMMQMIGVNLGLPLCLVLMDGSETNFSGWRGAVDEARKGFKDTQRRLANQLHKPLYRWLVKRWASQDSALRDAAKRDGFDITKHVWNTPQWSYIEPKADAEGDAFRLQNQLTSPRRLHAERGNTWQQIVDESVEDYATAIIAAKTKAAEINAKFPNEPPIGYRDLINLPMSNGIQMTLQDPNMVKTQADAVNAEEGVGNE